MNIAISRLRVCLLPVPSRGILRTHATLRLRAQYGDRLFMFLSSRPQQMPHSASKQSTFLFRADSCTPRIYMFGCNIFVSLVVLLSSTGIMSFFRLCESPLGLAVSCFHEFSDVGDYGIRTINPLLVSIHVQSF